MAFSKISILGVGLLGGSLGLACRSASSAVEVIGYSHKADELFKAIERGVIHRGFDDPARAVANCDLVILCTPVGLFRQLLTSIAPALMANAVVTDVGSTKRSVVSHAGELLPKHTYFVGSHPMVGGEKHGIDHARANLFTGGLCILTPNESTDLSALEKVDAFWQSLNMRTVQTTPDAHDSEVAKISHLPHALAAALMHVQSTESMNLAGRGFLDTTRIAGSDAAVWRDILLQNRDHLRSSLVRISSEIDQLLEKLEAGNPSEIERWLSAAAELRKPMRDKSGQP
jgi:prephenate dehydrogenase